MLKTKLKVLITLGIVLLAVFVFNMNTVNAESQNLLNDVPNTLEVGITTTEAVSEGEASEKLINSIKKLITTNITDYELVVYFEYSNNLNDLSKVTVSLYKGQEKVEEKSIEVKYTDNWNITDKQYVENKFKTLKLEGITLDYNATFEEINKTVSEEYSKLANDNSMKFNYEIAQGDIGFTEGRLTISKNNVIYYVAYTDTIKIIRTITIPTNIGNTEKEIKDYTLSKLKDYGFTDAEVKVNKGTNNYDYTLEVKSEDNSFNLYVIKETDTKPVTNTDTKTNIKLYAVAGVVPSNTILEVAPISEGTTYNTVKTALTNINKFKVFDINLLSNGAKIQPNGKVKISIPLPTDMNKSNLVVYRVANNGTKTEYKATTEGNYATFETDHFSIYVLAEKTAETTPSNTDDRKKDDTPKTGTVDVLGYLSIITLISALGIVAFRRNKIA